MNNLIVIFCVIFFSSNIFSQTKDTIFISFDDRNKEMRKVDFSRAMQALYPDENSKKSIDYYIEQMEPPNGYENELNFTHANRNKKTYNKFNLKPPLILKKPKSFLEGKKVLDIGFFRTTPYSEVTKTFEEEDSWEQDVMIFMVDVNEVKNDSIVLREVDFSRPVKQ